MSLTPPFLNDEKKPGPTCRPMAKMKNQAKFAHELQNTRIHLIAEMAHKDTDEQHESHTKRNSEKFDFSQIDTQCYHERQQHKG